MSDAPEVQVRALIEGEAFHVLSLRMRRALDEVGEAECELTDDAGGPEPKDLIGKTAELSMARTDGSSQATFVGRIVEATHVGGETPVPFVRLTVVPRLWGLGQRSDCRTFQQMPIDAIVKDVLERAGIAEQQWELGGSYTDRIYCVQHRETDLAFIRRLLSEEGITFSVEAKDGVDWVCFTDADLGDVEGATELPYRSEFGVDGSRDAVQAIEQTVRLTSDKVVVRDYDFERPDFELAGEAGDGKLETYAFPARTCDEGNAKQLAKVMHESFLARADLVSGETQTLHLAPGRRFSVTDHPYEPLNRDYLVVEVEHRYRESAWGSQAAEQDAHGCRFVAMPVDRPFRPRRLPRAPAVAGYCSAVVVGPAGSEIHPDEFGRVKAQHFWDREGDGTDQASCWMRTSQVPLGGGLFTPRVGWEVTVQHWEGDPDAPMVIGRMVTAKAPPPYALPEHKTRTTIQTATSPGGEGVNEIRFDDKKGAEEVFMNASKDTSVSAGNNSTETVGGSEVRTIGANHNLDVTGAKSANSADQAWNVSGSQKVGVATYMVDQNGGGHTLSIGGNRDLTVGGDHRRLVGGASKLDVAGMQVDLVAGTVTDSTNAAFSDTIGAALIEIAGGGRNVVCTDRTETVGAVKAVLATGGRGVEVGAAMTHDVAAAVAIKAKAGLNDNSDGKLTDVAAGAQIVKATNVTFTAETLLTVVCGGSTLTLTPGSVTLAGATIKLDGVTPQTAAMIKDN